MVDQLQPVEKLPHRRSCTLIQQDGGVSQRDKSKKELMGRGQREFNKQENHQNKRKQSPKGIIHHIPPADKGPHIFHTTRDQWLF